MRIKKMSPKTYGNRIKSQIWPAALLVSNLTFYGTGAAAKVALWDSMLPQGESLSLEDRSGWKAVPSDLLQLEAQPAKASSDPGFYGRDYTFKGDAVVENEKLLAVFWAAKGTIAIYSKGGGSSEIGGAGKGSEGRPVAELTSLQPGAPVHLKQVELIRNAGDQVVLQVTFSGNHDVSSSAMFSFDQTEIIEAKPEAKMKGMKVQSTLSYAISPSFIGDDLIFAPADYKNELTIPAQNLFLGLVAGENSEWVMTWPAGKQELRVESGQNPEPQRVFGAVDFENDGKSFYVAPLSAAGIWHKEPLQAAYLEKDIKLNWQKPFPARWKTQLYEEETKTTFAFREIKGDVWRGVPGSYNYPVWFEGQTAYYHLSKKVPPKGDSVVYFLEGQDTPASILTPVDILNATLGRQFSEPILDVAGRKLRTHHRRGGEGVRRACTCGCTEAIQAVFEAHEETTNTDYIQGALEDMIYFVHCHVERINEYQKFAAGLTNYLQAQASSMPELKPYLENLEQIARRLPEEYDVQKENMKSFQYADQLVGKTLALTHKADTNNLTAYMDLLKAWRGMGGAQDYVLAQCHTITRNLCQAAGYDSVTRPKALAVAQEVRNRCRNILRTPDGYEIWADY